MAYALPPLPYAKDALEPYIDTQTIEIHHDRHHNAYVNKFNAGIEGTELNNKSIEELFAGLSQVPADKQKGIRNNGGGAWNHSFYWEGLSPAGGTASSDLLNAINAKWGSLDKMKEVFDNAAATCFGSGWAWLYKNKAGELAIDSTPNQDNPLMDVAAIHGTPLLCIDVWEHAYYLKYQNKRPDYIQAFWNIINWNKVSERYAG